MSKRGHCLLIGTTTVALLTTAACSSSTPAASSGGGSSSASAPTSSAATSAAAAATSAAAAGSSSASAASPSTATASTTATKSTKHVVIGFANALNNNPTFIGMANVMEAQAKKRGWSVVLLNNNVDGPTALKNADLLIAKHVDYAVEFQVDSSVQPVIAKKFAAAHIPEITYDIPAPGAYFLGAPNMKAGVEAGVKLGDYAKATWDCKPDLVLDMEQVTAGEPSTLRTDGVAAGIQQVCPNITNKQIIRKDGGSTDATAQAAGRDVLAANPSAKKILVGALNDANVVGVIEAATQLGRASGVYGWGDDGSVLLGGGTIPPQLYGSVAFFLEGYPLLTLQLIDKLAAGVKVPVGDTPTSTDATFVDPCVIAATDASKIPPLAKRLATMEAAPTTATASSLFCPAS